MPKKHKHKHKKQTEKPRIFHSLMHSNVTYVVVVVVVVCSGPYVNKREVLQLM